MDEVNQIPFNFDPRIGVIIGVMVGFLVFAVSLDLTWEKLLRALPVNSDPTKHCRARFMSAPILKLHG